MFRNHSLIAIHIGKFDVLTLQVMLKKFFVSSGVSVNSPRSSCAFGPITLIAVYMDVTSLICTDPSAGAFFRNQAKARVCRLVGLTMKYLLNKTCIFFCKLMTITQIHSDTLHRSITAFLRKICSHKTHLHKYRAL